MSAFSFNLVAPIYDQLAHFVFGRAIKLAQLETLKFIPQGTQVLIIGGGTGWILKELLDKAICSRVVYLEASDKMLNKTRQLISDKDKAANNIEFRLGTEENLHLAEKFDVVISNFLLDLFAPVPLKKITYKLFHALTPGGLWLVTDFVQPQKRGIKIWGDLLFKSMYLFFRLTCNISASALPDWENLLQSYPLKSGESWYFYHGLIKSVMLQKIPPSVTK